MAIAADDRPVVSDRETKSVSVEDTFETDIIDRSLLAAIADRMAHRVAERLQKAQLSGRTVTVKTRMHDFTTHTRSSTLAGPTDDARVVARVARRLLEESDIVRRHPVARCRRLVTRRLDPGRPLHRERVRRRAALEVLD